MPKYLMTQSLLSSWQYAVNSDDLQPDLSDFLSTLRRETSMPNEAMQRGIDFENDVNFYVDSGGHFPYEEHAEIPVKKIAEETHVGEHVNHDTPYNRAVKRIGEICMGGQSQVKVSKSVTVNGVELLLYGRLDYLKAGVIYDIKRPGRYEYGKYFDSPQHPMYLDIIPEARAFKYLIFDGGNVYVEAYNRGDFQPIERTVAQFLNWLEVQGLGSVYREHWLSRT